MKITAMVVMAGVLGVTAWAGSLTEENQDGRVTVCMNVRGEGLLVNRAQLMATWVFADIGVKLEWHTDRRFCQTQRDQVIVVSLSTNTPETLLPGVLAYARPVEGVHIQLFYDRILDFRPDLVPHLLAYVLVHEITHILQGTCRHSENGIMKTHWATDDFEQMMTRRLPFADVDVKLIHHGLIARRAYQAPGTLIAAVAP